MLFRPLIFSCTSCSKHTYCTTLNISRNSLIAVIWVHRKRSACLCQQASFSSDITLVLVEHLLVPATHFFKNARFWHYTLVVKSINIYMWSRGNKSSSWLCAVNLMIEYVLVTYSQLSLLLLPYIVISTLLREKWLCTIYMAWTSAASRLHFSSLHRQ